MTERPAVAALRDALQDFADAVRLFDSSEPGTHEWVEAGKAVEYHREKVLSGAALEAPPERVSENQATRALATALADGFREKGISSIDAAASLIREHDELVEENARLRGEAPPEPGGLLRSMLVRVRPYVTNPQLNAEVGALLVAPPEPERCTCSAFLHDPDCPERVGAAETLARKQPEVAPVAARERSGDASLAAHSTCEEVIPPSPVLYLRQPNGSYTVATGAECPMCDLARRRLAISETVRSQLSEALGRARETLVNFEIGWAEQHARNAEVNAELARLRGEAPPETNEEIRERHVDGVWCANLRCGQCYGADRWIESVRGEAGPLPPGLDETALDAAERAYWQDNGVSRHNLGVAILTYLGAVRGVVPAPPPDSDAEFAKLAAIIASIPDERRRDFGTFAALLFDRGVRAVPAPQEGPP